MMEQIQTYILLFAIIVIIGQIFAKSRYPISLLLVITGMLLSYVPNFPTIILKPEIVLNIILPLLLYQISSFSSWKDIKKHMVPIGMLSIGHVIFITFLVAIVMHTLIPELGWPLAFVLGAVLSPPDDVAIVSIAEKIRMPTSIITVLEGEGLLNDATALTIFRFALAATITHQFSAIHAVTTFFAIIIGETLYGLAFGYLIGQLRLKISDPFLHLIASFLTPFLAYLPPVMLGGSGVIATVVTGFVIGHVYAVKFTPEFRLISRGFWPALSFSIQSILFLLVGLDLREIIERIYPLSFKSLLIYSIAVVLTVIIGRFIWVFATFAYIPKVLIPSRRKNSPPWQYPFIVSSAGMRGAISLAAALAVPTLPAMVEGVNPRDLLIFLVFVVIAATFVIQGMSLPWLLKILGVQKYGEHERYKEHLAELAARVKMVRAVLRFLDGYKEQVKDNPKLYDEVELYIREYKMLKKQLKDRIKDHDDEFIHDEKQEAKDASFLLSQIIDVERTKLLQLWKREEINLAVRNKLLERLDHSSKDLE